MPNFIDFLSPFSATMSVMETPRPPHLPDSLELNDLLGYARRKVNSMTRNPEWADEAVAEVFSKLAGLPYWPEHPYGWISVALQNKIYDFSRRKDLQNRVDLVAGNQANSTDNADFNPMERILLMQNTSQTFFLKQLLREVKDSVSERELELLLAVAEGLSHQEIADMFGYASAASVSQTLFRLRDRLRQEFSAWDFDFITRKAT